MKKEEVVYLHMLLAQLKKFFEQHGLDCDFSKYRELNISPFQVHRSKDEHKQAVFVLGKELASMALKHNYAVHK
jgi:hypothetical protein